MLMDNKKNKKTVDASSATADVWLHSTTSSRLILVLLLSLLGCQSTEVGAFSTSPQPRMIRQHQQALSMARPGQSEAHARAERENEIRQKLAQLQSSGKMKGGTSSSMMDQAEKFFNVESPARKFELRNKKRKADAAAAALLADQDSASSEDGADDAISAPLDE